MAKSVDTGVGPAVREGDLLGKEIYAFYPKSGGVHDEPRLAYGQEVVFTRDVPIYFSMLKGRTIREAFSSSKLSQSEIALGSVRAGTNATVHGTMMRGRHIIGVHLVFKGGTFGEWIPAREKKLPFELLGKPIGQGELDKLVDPLRRGIWRDAGYPSGKYDFKQKPKEEAPPLPTKKGAASVVFDVKGDREIHMQLPAREAIIAAYAQFRKKDFDHPLYEKRYGHLVKPIDRSGKWDLPPGFTLEDFVAYDADKIQKARDKSLTQKLPQGTIRTRAPRVVPPPRMPPPERAAKPKPKRERHVTAKELMRPPAADDVLAGSLSRLQATVEDVIRGAGRKRR